MVVPVDYLPELRSLAKKLTETEAELSAFFHLCPLLFVVAKRTGHFSKVNAAWEKAFGYTSEEMTSQPWLAFVHPDDLAKTLAVAGRMDTDRVDRFENRYRRKDGTYHTVSWIASRWYDNETAFCVAEIKAPNVEPQFKGSHSV